jgi:predicted MFS family arabinose efflux permease
VAKRPAVQAVLNPEGPAIAPRKVGFRAWMALSVLCFVYMINFLDRQLLSILAKPVEDSLHITDGQLGRISGLYFALFYGLISIPVGWLADRTHRVRILALACAIWSAATVGCGLAASYAQLVAARMTVGFGEAGGVPPSYAIISDYFPPGRRGTALGIYNLGPPLGQAMGIAVGASIAAAFGWRPAFLVLGAVGVGAALLILVAVREPRRGGLDIAAPARTGGRDREAPGLMATLRHFLSKPPFVLAALASGAAQMVTYGAGNFTALFLVREKGMSLRQMALYYALVVGLFMSAGIFASGRAADRFTARHRSAYGLIPAAALVCALPLFLAFVFAPHWPLAVLFLAGPTFFNSFYLSCVVTLVQQESRPDERVLSGAILLLIMNLIGLGLGPTFVGAMSDFLAPSHPGHGLKWALLSLSPFYLLAIGLFLTLAWTLREAPQTGKDPVS